MKQNILVCNDGRVPDLDEALQAAKTEGLSGDGLRSRVCEAINFDGALCRHLREKGHNVTLFDGHSGKEFRTQITSSAELANQIANLIMQKTITCMTLDLNWFKDFQKGVEILRRLVRDQAIPIDMKNHILIYSRYTNDPSFNYESILTNELRIPRDNILTRDGVDIYGVADIIDRMV